MRTRRVVAGGGWMCDEIPQHGAVHVWPVGDTLAHDLDDPGGGCLCGPYVDSGVVVHNSFDQRERYEGFAGALRDLGEAARNVGELLVGMALGLFSTLVGRSLDED